MSNTIEAPPGANANLNNAKAYYLGAHAGVIPPREAFQVQVAAIHEAVQSDPELELGQKVEQITSQIGALAVMKPPVEAQAVNDDDMRGMLRSLQLESVRNPLIALLISKGAISVSLKQEFGLHIPDSAYDDFLAELNSEEPEEYLVGDSVQQTEGPIKLKDSEVKGMLSAKTLEEFDNAYKEHPYFGTLPLAQKRNEILDKAIIAQGSNFEQSVEYFSARIDLGEEHVDAQYEEKVRLALDNKFLNRATQFADAQLHDQLIKLLKAHKIVTDEESEHYDGLMARFRSVEVPAILEAIKSVEPEDITGVLSWEVSAEQLEQLPFDETINLRDYSKVKLDLQGLSHPERAAELVELYKMCQTDDDVQSKRLFIENVLQEMRRAGISYGELAGLAEIRSVVDSEEIKQEAAEIHDTQLLSITSGLYKVENYAMVLVMLQTEGVRYLLDDGHPIVEAGRKVFEDSYSQFRKTQK